MPNPVPSVRPPWAQVVRVAAAQRLMIWIFLAGLLSLPLSFLGTATTGVDAAAILFLALVLAVRLAMAVAMYRTAAALGSRRAVLWAIGGFLPSVIGPIVLLVLNGKATRFLKDAGQKPGFMGAKVPSQPPPGYEGLEQVFS